MKNALIIVIVISLFILAGCVRKTENATIKKNTTIAGSLGEENLLADTIIYPVTIYNFDPYDDWAEYRLHKIQRKRFIEEVFDAIYSENLTVYHYYDDYKLTIEDIKKLEASPDFSRDRIEEIQFVETWHFSPALKQFQKEVHSIVLAYALYTEEGQRRGLKGAFRIKLKPGE